MGVEVHTFAMCNSLGAQGFFGWFGAQGFFGWFGARGAGSVPHSFVSEMNNTPPPSKKKKECCSVVVIQRARTHLVHASLVHAPVRARVCEPTTPVYVSQRRVLSVSVKRSVLVETCICR